MANKESTFQDLLAARSRADLRSLVHSARVKLTIAQAQALIGHADSLGDALHTLRLAIVHTYTSDLLDPWLHLAAALEGLKLDVYHAPYGFTLQEAQPESGLVKHNPDLILLLLRREDLHPDFTKPIVAMPDEQRSDVQREALERLLSIVTELRSHASGQIVVTLLPSALPPALGMFDSQADRSEDAFWAGFKMQLAQRLRESVRSALLLDLDELLRQVGRPSFFDLRLWYAARFPFGVEAARELARRVIAVGAVIKLPKAKVIVLDADNTLWGGIVGEDGPDGIALGTEYPGNAFVEFQRRLLEYQQRGFILALCSKNNEADVDEVFKNHPHQLLRDDHFAARRVNWLPKPDNLVALAEELGLGLDSFILVDDSDHECAAVRKLCPQVEVVKTPARPVDIPGCLEQVARLEVLSLTTEDLAKTELYAQERRRRESREQAEKTGGDLRGYLAWLQMKMRVSLNDERHLTRLAQLTQKTNQFNLTTRRYNEQQMQTMIQGKDWLIADFSVADLFGDAGIVGLAMIRRRGHRSAQLDNFLMSCRVIGRQVEAAFMHALLRRLAEQGVAELTAEFIPTAKNDLARNFLSEQGFTPSADGLYTRDLLGSPPSPESAFPIAIDVVESGISAA